MLAAENGALEEPAERGIKEDDHLPAEEIAEGHTEPARSEGIDRLAIPAPMPHVEAVGDGVHAEIDVEGQQGIEGRCCPQTEAQAVTQEAGSVADDSPADA